MRVVIAGGGNVGTYIAAELQQVGHEVLIIEVDPARVAQAQADGEPVGVTWLNVDGCEVSEFAKAEPARADVVVAVTGDDEDNLVISLLAKQEFSVPRVIARVNNPSNEWMFNASWGVDVSVSTPHMLTALVEEAVTVGSLVRIMAFENDSARLSEIRLADNSPANGVEIRELDLPRESTVVAVVRDGKVIFPRGEVRLGAGDEVLVLAMVESEDQVRRVLVGE
jgi:trk system potassium uptake protein